MVLRFVPRNDLGVLDHYVRTAAGEEILNPMRILENGSGSEVLFTLFQRPDMSEEAFLADAAMVEADLGRLQELFGRET
jgi:hypothetical protein